MTGPRFAALPVDALEDKRLTKVDLAVLNDLGRHADLRTGWCYRAQKTLAEVIGVSRRTIQRSLDRLLDLRYVDRELRLEDGKGQDSNLYRVLFEPTQSLSRAHGGDAIERQGSVPCESSEQSRPMPISSRRWAVWRKTNGDCCYCGAAVAAEYGAHTVVRRVSMDVDHAIPLARGGANRIANLLPACQPCNNRKSTKTVAEFLLYERARTGISNYAFHEVAMAFIVEVSS